MDYHDMDDGENFLYWATGIPPQKHLDDIGYRKHTTLKLYQKFIDKLKKMGEINAQNSRRS